ncbi:MAG: hypothetical protein LBM60_07005, partial [Clostridium sp.]|nr:hypothetical protein [Clostridium sp.]
MNDINTALGRKFGKQIIKTEHQEKSLLGGTLGDVRLVSGVAETAYGEKLPFEVVHKKQTKWERFGDPHSWRREVDLYQAGFEQYFGGDLRIPACYLAKINSDETEMEQYTEFIGGVSGKDWTTDLLERAAYLWGRFQGEHRSINDTLRGMKCINDA